MKTTTLEIYKGTTEGYELLFYEDGLLIDITGWKIYFTVKEKMNDSDANAKIAKTISSHEDATNGKTLIELSKADTNITKGNYYYSIDYLDDEDNEDVLVQGRLRIIEPVLDSRS